MSDKAVSGIRDAEVASSNLVASTLKAQGLLGFFLFVLYFVLHSLIKIGIYDDVDLLPLR